MIESGPANEPNPARQPAGSPDTATRIPHDDEPHPATRADGSRDTGSRISQHGRSNRAGGAEPPEGTGGGRGPSRLDRRKAQTRAALVRAAQGLLAAGRVNVAVSEIAKAADVGHGSFYNHFDSKDELFRAAVEEALDEHGALFDALGGPLDDPAEVFAQGFRLAGRLHRRQPELSRVLLHDGLTVASSNRGLRPRALRDVVEGVRAGRFTVRVPELAVTIIAGAALTLGRLLHDRPDLDDASAADQMAEDLLRMLGVPPDEAHAISHRPLPALDAPTATRQP